ncbi:MAG: hypothetical protein QNI92_09990 [Desulfobacterales bacterium]|nr:hypothetical protein [Desulfobacterales bacterium]MDJ0916081.1 hypothetical protein [Desulfobacterales bacterium]
MATKFRNRWIFIGILWTAVFILNVMNISEIQQILTAREQNEIFAHDEDFWKRNEANISQVMQLRAALYPPVDSLQLALLNLENDLMRSAKQHGLKEMDIISQAELGQPGQLPIMCRCKGSFNGMLQWLQRMNTKYPHIQIKTIQALKNPKLPEVKYIILVQYRYRLTNEHNEA